METLAAQALCGIMERALIAEGVNPTVARALAERACKPAVTAAATKAKGAVRKTRKKVSKYNRQFGKELRKLKAKHKRTPVSQLMARAHRATKRALK